MNYSREADLSQKQAIDNMCAVLSSDYFKAYEFCFHGSRIRSDIIDIDSIGGEAGNERGRIKVEDLSRMLIYLFRTIQTKGTLHEIKLSTTPSQERLHEMGFENGLFEADENFDLPLVFRASMVSERFKPTGKYCFKVAHAGFEESFFQEHDLNVRTAEKLLPPWYSSISRNLNVILPNPIELQHRSLESQLDRTD